MFLGDRSSLKLREIESHFLKTGFLKETLEKFYEQNLYVN